MSQPLTPELRKYIRRFTVNSKAAIPGWRRSKYRAPGMGKNLLIKEKEKGEVSEEASGRRFVKEDRVLLPASPSPPHL